MSRSSLAAVIGGALVVLVAVWFVAGALARPGQPDLGGTVRVSSVGNDGADPSSNAPPGRSQAVGQGSTGSSATVPERTTGEPSPTRSGTTETRAGSKTSGAAPVPGGTPRPAGVAGEYDEDDIDEDETDEDDNESATESPSATKVAGTVQPVQGDEDDEEG